MCTLRYIHVRKHFSDNRLRAFGLKRYPPICLPKTRLDLRIEMRIIIMFLSYGYLMRIPWSYHRQSYTGMWIKDNCAYLYPTAELDSPLRRPLREIFVHNYASSSRDNFARCFRTRANNIRFHKTVSMCIYLPPPS